MVHVSCNLCGTDDFDIVFAAGRAQSQQIVRCKACGLLYANPRTGELDAALVALHDPEFLPQMLQREHDPRRDKESLQVRDYATTRDFLAGLFPRRGRLVEIGCGLGFLLDYFHRDGWQVLGVDPDRLMARHAEEVLGVKVSTTTLTQAALDEAAFDVVLMMNVIEHLHDPAATLRDIHRLLKPGGVLVVETPRLDNWTFRLLGRRERNIACEGHVYFFTTRTLCALAKKAGLAVLRCDAVGRSLTADRLLWQAGIVTRLPTLQRLLHAASRACRLDAVHLTLNLRDIQRLYLQRPA